MAPNIMTILDHVGEKKATFLNAINPNLTISLDKNTHVDKVSTRKNYLAHKMSSGRFYRDIKSIVTFRPILR